MKRNGLAPNSVKKKKKVKKMKTTINKEMEWVTIYFQNKEEISELIKLLSFYRDNTIDKLRIEIVGSCNLIFEIDEVIGKQSK